MTRVLSKLQTDLQVYLCMYIAQFNTTKVAQSASQSQLLYIYHKVDW